MAAAPPGGGIKNAAVNGDVSALKLWFSTTRRDPDACDADGWTLLCLAAFYGQVETMRVLLDHGASVNAATDIWSPLRAAADRGRCQAADLLLDRGADVNARNKYNKSALTSAGLNGHCDMIRLLLRRGAVYVDDVRGRAVHVEARHHHHVRCRCPQDRVGRDARRRSKRPRSLPTSVRRAARGRGTSAPRGRASWFSGPCASAAARRATTPSCAASSSRGSGRRRRARRRRRISRGRCSGASSRTGAATATTRRPGGVRRGRLRSRPWPGGARARS